MDLDGTTAERLRALSSLTGQADLSVAVLDLARSTIAAVPSCVAILVALPGVEDSVLLATRAFQQGAVTAHSSLRLDLRPDGEQPRRMIFLAADSHAFFAFTHSRTYIDHDRLDGRSPGHRIHHLAIDEDIPAEGADGLRAQSELAVASVEAHRSIERAIGFLIDAGLSVADALVELTDRAKAADRTILEQAEETIKPRPRLLPAADEP